MNLQVIKQIIAEKKRADPKWTQQYVAEKAGMTRQNLNRIIKESSTTHDTLETLSRVLGVPISTFYDTPPTMETDPKDKLIADLMEMLKKANSKIERLEEEIRLLKSDGHEQKGGAPSESYGT